MVEMSIIASLNIKRLHATKNIKKKFMWTATILIANESINLSGLTTDYSINQPYTVVIPAILGFLFREEAYTDPNFVGT